MSDTSPVLLGRAFRPFFLLAGLQAVLGVGLWLAILRGHVATPGWSTPFQWHAHEMLFGFATASIAGFLLTSVPAWTGLPALTGRGLAALATLWISGRLAIFFASQGLAQWIAMGVDVSFLAVLGGLIGGAIYGARSRRNYGFPVMVLVLAGANALSHLDALGVWPGAGQTGMRLGIGVVVMLVGILGGRLVPLFTRAALKRAGHEVEVSHLDWADRASAPLMASFVAVDTLWPDSAPGGVLALLTAAVFALRTRGWALRHTFGDALLWSMHLAYLWIPIGLAMLGLTALTAWFPRGLANHVLTVGVIGGMILAIMTRVALGHTGRPFVAPRGIALAYGALLCAVPARTLLPALWPAASDAWIPLSGSLWIGAFGLFLAIYSPFLVAPRVDGKPG
jgi:uncharacterized protein involved in response to NO